MVIFGTIAGFLLAAVVISLAVFAVLPVFERRAEREHVDHDLVVECLENADELIGAGRLGGARELVGAGVASGNGNGGRRPDARYGVMSGGRWQ